MVLAVKAVRLDPKTLEAFDAYIHNDETEMEQSLQATGSFLWSQQAAERAQVVDQGQVVAHFWTGEGPVKVPKGLIHDWIAAALIPDSNIQEILSVMQEYDRRFEERNAGVVVECRAISLTRDVPFGLG